MLAASAAAATSAAATLTAAAALAAAAALSAALAAALAAAFAVLGSKVRSGVFLVVDVEGRQADVEDFFLTERDDMTPIRKAKSGSALQLRPMPKPTA